MSNLILALDFGGTKFAAAVTDNRDSWIGKDLMPAPAPASAQADYAGMLAMARKLLAGRQAAAIGVSFGGPVDAARNTVILSHHVPGWEQVPLGEWLQRDLGAPAAIDNDANAGALGEYTYGAGQNCSSVFYITVSTGVGGGLVADGRVWHGANGMAGEIGHMQVDPAGPLCLCGKHGCVERLASGPYMAADARTQMTSGSALWVLCAGEAGQITGQLVAAAATRGDEVAIRLIERSATALGRGIGNTANIINPQRFVVGGGVTKAGSRWWQVLQAAARATALPEITIDIAPAQLIDDAPLWGAVALAKATGTGHQP